MRRIKQELSQEECLAILSTAPRGILSVLGDGGYPYGIPMNFFHDGGHLYFHCAPEGHKLDALRACDKACFTVLGEPVRESGDWWYHVRSVVCFGTVRSVPDGPERLTLLRRLGEKYFPEGYDLQRDLDKNGPHAVILDFTIEHLSGKAVREK